MLFILTCLSDYLYPLSLYSSQLCFECMQELDTELVVATARGTTTNTTAVSANIVVDERQMNALFLDLVS